ncbi:MAG: hypothetical protein ABIG11_08650 [bacterium]
MLIPRFKSRPSAAKLLVLLFGVLFALLLAEAAVRIGGKVFPFLQERRNRISLSRGGYRILCLGESTTALGGGEAWPAQLELLLNERYPDVRFSVVNKGRASIDTSFIMQNLERNLDEVRPDLVIAMMGINDGFIRYYEGVSGAGSPLFRHSRLYKWFRLLLHQKDALLPRNPRNAIKPAPQSGNTAQRNPHDSNSRRRYFKAQSGYPGPPDPYDDFRNGTRDIADSEDSLRKRLERNPDDAYALYILGTYWTRPEEEYRRPDLAQKGERLLMRAARLDPKNSFVLRTLGLNLVFRDPERAISLLEKAVELNPGMTDWYALGCAYMSHNMFDKAEAALLKAVDLNAVGAVFALTRYYIKAKRFAEAEELLQEAREFHPDNERYLGALTRLYRESGHPELARRHEAELAATRAMFTETTHANFRELKRILDSRGIHLALMQYPMCALAPLRRLLDDPGNVIFIDNERVFKTAVADKGYAFYFRDMFAGNFGHCSLEGNRLIARDAADALSGYFAALPPK